MKRSLTLLCALALLTGSVYANAQQKVAAVVVVTVVGHKIMCLADNAEIPCALAASREMTCKIRGKIDNKTNIPKGDCKKVIERLEKVLAEQKQK